MSLKDDLTAVERSLDDLARTVGKLEAQLGKSLDIRRVRSDTDHLRESLGLLKQSAGAGRPPRPGAATQEMVSISDAPYNSALWTDAQDEGLGSRNGHAP
ncbi:hypothetical protein BX264_4665 [Streptomyces sp. 2333.5]|uniref:hypothetical protein n=1 Tax=Streptomyces TaxID=1883 RepID=UPI0008987FC9|nr:MULTISPECIES: hypothetical protein [Streptomyces]MCF3174639.1 hypothetical protein [Streptomyces sioyaensis]PJJ04260.1 hypothetical protein BX264_4665 [Streptomyces sp. 2333.5]SEE45660.1 hypothetical protein SAMN05428943_4776 [Streptomyces sp. 2314.4]SEE72606.1 hypothetical protein SAMN05428942_4766 [Streptomyces sp. 2112.2]